jgi:U3 small nucleolar RNA-associated protein 6
VVVIFGKLSDSWVASFAALPKIELFEALNSLLLEYPTQPNVRTALLEHLHDLLRSTLPDDAGAIQLLARRFLTPELKGEAFVEGLQSANEEMVQSVGEGRREPALRAYAAFVEQWCGAAIDVNLVSLVAIPMAGSMLRLLPLLTRWCLPPRDLLFFRNNTSFRRFVRSSHGTSTQTRHHHCWQFISD